MSSVAVPVESPHRVLLKISAGCVLDVLRYAVMANAGRKGKRDEADHRAHQ